MGPESPTHQTLSGPACSCCSVSLLAPVLISRLAAPIWRYYAGWCDKLAGKSYLVDGDGGAINIVVNEPLGVCAAISAWNGTIMSVAWKCAAALAAENTVIHKRSEKRPLGCLTLGNLVIEAGFPPGVLNFVSGAGETGALLASYMQTAKATGKRVQAVAAPSNLKRVTLDLGGKSPALVFADADVETALVHVTQIFLLNSGQACVAGRRVLVEESITEESSNKMKERFEALTGVTGDPEKEWFMFGPLADKQQFERVMGFIEKGRSDGAKVLTGGKRLGKDGYFVAPTIFVDAKDNTIYRDEIFGPVLVINTFKTEEEVVKLANDTTYDLAAHCYTKGHSQAIRVSSKLEAGNVTVNTSSVIHINPPFGGFKQSEIGKESGKDGLMAHVNNKTITINIGSSNMLSG